MDVSKILPNLFVGSHPSSREDIDRLRKEFGITAVLNVQTEEDFAYWGLDWTGLQSRYREAGVEIRRVPVRDFDPDDLRRNLPQCVQVLDELLKNGHVVYVHCSMGINRSPSTIIAYLHWVEQQDLDAATAHVLRCRQCAPYLDAIRLAGVD